MFALHTSNILNLHNLKIGTESKPKYFSQIHANVLVVRRTRLSTYVPSVYNKTDIRHVNIYIYKKNCRITSCAAHTLFILPFYTTTTRLYAVA